MMFQTGFAKPAGWAMLGAIYALITLGLALVFWGL